MRGGQPVQSTRGPDGRPRHGRRTCSSPALVGSANFRATRLRSSPSSWAARAAVCIDNARPTGANTSGPHPAAQPLPPGDPEASASTYRLPPFVAAGTAATEVVGGDWFDVIQLPGHRIALVVGDVMGRGSAPPSPWANCAPPCALRPSFGIPEPAGRCCPTSTIARGLGAPSAPSSPASRSTRPAARTLRCTATCVYAVYDPVTRRCTFANAGPPAARARGTWRGGLLLDVPPGMPLVGGELPSRRSRSSRLRARCRCLYTDVACRVPRPSARRGPERVPQRLPANPGRPLLRTSATTSSAPSTPARRGR